MVMLRTLRLFATVFLACGLSLASSASLGAGTVSVISERTGQVVNTIRVSANPQQIAVGPGAGTGYVANQWSGTVSALGP